MPKITRTGGPSFEPSMPEPEGPQTPADVMRARGKLGPYPDPQALEGTTEGLMPEDGPQRVVDGHGDADAETTELEADGEATELEGPDDGPELEQGDGEELTEVPDEPARPSTSATKADWLAYAQALHPGEDLSAYTRADLIELYGEH